MSILAILPAKSLDQSKSRLSHVLSARERETFSLSLLRRTVRILKSSKSVSGALIVSRDPRVRSLAKTEDVIFLQEQGIGMNWALEQATQWSMNHHFSAVLVLSLDVPFLRRADIDSIVRIGEQGEEIVVIAPDRQREGTNALFVKPPGTFEYQFGFRSFLHHSQQARDRRIETRFYYSFGTSFDVDFPHHFESMVQMERSWLNSFQGH